MAVSAASNNGRSSVESPTAIDPTRADRAKTSGRAAAFVFAYRLRVNEPSYSFSLVTDKTVP